jgi:hypothetical protein
MKPKPRRTETGGNHLSNEALSTPRVSGKFFYQSHEKLFIRGVTYGTFEPPLTVTFQSPLNQRSTLRACASQTEYGSRLYRAAGVVARRGRPSRFVRDRGVGLDAARVSWTMRRPGAGDPPVGA